MASGPRGKIPLCSPLTQSHPQHLTNGASVVMGIEPGASLRDLSISFCGEGTAFLILPDDKKARETCAGEKILLVEYHCPTDSLLHLLSFPNEINGWCLLVSPVKLKLHASHSCISFKLQFLVYTRSYLSITLLVYCCFELDFFSSGFCLGKQKFVFTQWTSFRE